MACAFLSTAGPLNVIKSFRNPVIGVVVDENHPCCKMFPGLARCILNPASLRDIRILEETEDEAPEINMEADLEDRHKLLYDPDAPDEEGE
jgi:hypothetical protein